jgi:signal peptide peptidase SppA
MQIRGPLLPHAGMMADVSQEGTAVETLREEFRTLVADDRVRAIVMDIDSPGGAVDLIPEFADEIRAARADKPVVAVANTMAASGAYWIAYAASELAVTPSGDVGSIGVYVIHDDLSGALERERVTKTIISAGEYKVEGNPFEPLSEEALAYRQDMVATIYDQFVGAVAEGRGVTTKKVEEDFGKGRMVLAPTAVKSGMADRVATVDQEVSRLERKLARSASSPTRAAALPAREPEPHEATTRAAGAAALGTRSYLTKGRPQWQITP